MNNIVFLNFDFFNTEKIKYFNNVNSLLNKNKYKLILLSSTDINKAKFSVSKFEFDKFYIKDNFSKIKKILKFTKKKESDWIKVLSLYYEKRDTDYLKNKINCIIYIYLEFLIKNEPKLAIVWTEYHPLCQIFISICNYFRIKFLIAERGLLNETIVLEKNGIYGKSYVTKSKIKNYKINSQYYLFNKIHRKLKNKWKFERKNKTKKNYLKNTKKKIFFAGTNEIWHGFYPYNNSQTSPLYKSHFQALCDLSKIIEKYENISIIFKPHPKDRIFSYYEKFVPKNIIIEKKENAIELIKKTDLFITIASSLVCDAIFYKKQSIILGRFEISNKNICHEVKKKSDLDRFIRLFNNNKLKKKNSKNWRNFINYIPHQYLYNVSKYKFGKLNHEDFTRKLLYNVNTSFYTNSKHLKLKKILKNIKIKYFLKDLIRSKIKAIYGHTF